MQSRKDALTALLELDAPHGEIIENLKQFEWDSDVELVTLRRSHIAEVLRRFIVGELTSQAVEDWANAIEGRDDIGFDPQFTNLLKDAVFEIANPLLNEPITTDFARAWIDRLNA